MPSKGHKGIEPLKLARVPTQGYIYKQRPEKDKKPNIDTWISKLIHRLNKKYIVAAHLCRKDRRNN